MDGPKPLPGCSEIIERIFAASSLEEAIFWRQAMLTRLVATTEGNRDLTDEEIRLHREAMFQTELSLERLRFCLLNEERTTWRVGEREWQTTALWTKFK